MQGRGLRHSSDKLSSVRHCKMLTAALSFFGFSSDLIKWRPLLRSDSPEGQHLCWKHTILSFIHCHVFIFSSKVFFCVVCDRKLGVHERCCFAQIWQRLSCACACKATQKQQQSWASARRLGSICQLINTTGFWYPYVGICTAFNVVINVSGQV